MDLVNLLMVTPRDKLLKTKHWFCFFCSVEIEYTNWLAHTRCYVRAVKLWIAPSLADGKTEVAFSQNNKAHFQIHIYKVTILSKDLFFVSANAQFAVACTVLIKRII